MEFDAGWRGVQALDGFPFETDERARPTCARYGLTRLPIGTECPNFR